MGQLRPVVVEHVSHAGVVEDEVAVFLRDFVKLSLGVERFGAELLKDHTAAVLAVQLALEFPIKD